MTEEMASNGTPGEQRSRASVMSVCPPEGPQTVDDAGDPLTADTDGTSFGLTHARQTGTARECAGTLGALQRLSPDHRQILVDAGVRRQPESMIAARLELPVGAVRSRLHHAMRELHRELVAARLRGSGE